jgi:hypothetical protein
VDLISSKNYIQNYYATRRQKINSTYFINFNNCSLNESFHFMNLRFHT